MNKGLGQKEVSCRPYRISCQKQYQSRRECNFFLRQEDARNARRSSDGLLMTNKWIRLFYTNIYTCLRKLAADCCSSQLGVRIASEANRHEDTHQVHKYMGFLPAPLEKKHTSAFSTHRPLR